jgi:DeoR/GlpR family transcriptional regulator of sugar metabolism
MMAQERRLQLLELVRARGFASYPELAEALAVSESTVRRDVEYLEERGSTSRIHGGVLYAGSSPKLPHFEAREPARWEPKRSVARRAAELIEDGDTLLLDGGSTTYELARLLVGRRLHVVTNSLPVANLLAADAAMDVVMIGGNISSRSGVVQGPYADRMITSLRVQKTFFSVAAVNEEGFYNNNLLLVETERAMMKAADEVIVVVDSSKFGRQSLTHLCQLGDVSYVVVDNGIEETWRASLLDAGVKLLVAGENAKHRNET